LAEPGEELDGLQLVGDRWHAGDHNPVAAERPLGPSPELPFDPPAATVGAELRYSESQRDGPYASADESHGVRHVAREDDDLEDDHDRNADAHHSRRA
jgi:hypothetical protein